MLFGHSSVITIRTDYISRPCVHDLTRRRRRWWPRRLRYPSTGSREDISQEPDKQWVKEDYRFHPKLLGQRTRKTVGIQSTCSELFADPGRWDCAIQPKPSIINEIRRSFRSITYSRSLTNILTISPVSTSCAATPGIACITPLVAI